MVFTIREALEGFRTAIVSKQGRIHDSTKYTPYITWFHLNIVRIEVLSKWLSNKRNHLHNYLIETIECIPLVDVTFPECPCIAPQNFSWKKTSFNIPQPLDGSFLSIHDLNGNRYTEIEWDLAAGLASGRNKRIRESRRYAVKTIGSNTGIYIFNDIHSDGITVRAAFLDPSELDKLPLCGQKKNFCKKRIDSSFKIEAELLPAIYDLTYKRLIEWEQRILPDPFIDDRDNSRNQTIK